MLNELFDRLNVYGRNFEVSWMSQRELKELESWEILRSDEEKWSSTFFIKTTFRDASP